MTNDSSSRYINLGAVSAASVGLCFVAVSNQPQDNPVLVARY